MQRKFVLRSCVVKIIIHIIIRELEDLAFRDNFISHLHDMLNDKFIQKSSFYLSVWECNGHFDCSQIQRFLSDIWNCCKLGIT